MMRIQLGLALAIAACLSAASSARAAAPCSDTNPIVELRPTVEVHCDHPEIVAKAEELGTPLAMFKFVHDEIEFQVYYGSRKGALGALRSGRANDYDQASLLIALLRAGGHRARYGIGVANIDEAQLSQWSGVTNGRFAQLVFHYMYCTGVFTSTYGPCVANPPRFYPNDATGFDYNKVYMERAWVEVLLPEHYRGTNVDASAEVWLPIDPAWKQKLYPPTPAPADRPPIGDEITGDCSGKICFDYDAYLSKVDRRLASEVWERQLTEWLAAHNTANGTDLALADVIHDGPIIPYEGEVLPASLPFFPEDAHGAQGSDPTTAIPATPAVIHPTDLGAPLGTLPDGLKRRYKVSVKVRNSSSTYNLKEFDGPAIVDERVTVSFAPTTTARTTVLRNGGYLGGWDGSGSYANLTEYCVANSSSSSCGTNVVLRLDGAQQSLLSTPPTLPLGSTSFQLRIEVDQIPGVPKGYDRNIVVGENVALAVDLDGASADSIRDGLADLVALRDSTNLVDETLYAENDDDDPNGNGIPGEVLIDQGAAGIQTGCDYNASSGATALATCDIAIAAKFDGNDGLIGELLYLAGLRYYQRSREEATRLYHLDRYYAFDFPAAGIVKSGVHFTYLFDQPVGVEPATPMIDVPGFLSVISPVDSVDPYQIPHRVGRRVMLVYSALEHQVWEELIGSEFVSTVRGIQLVRERYPDQPLIYADYPSWSTTRSQLESFRFDTIGASTLTAMAPNGADDITISPIAAVSAEPSSLEVYFKEDAVGGGGFQFSATIAHNGQTAGGAMGNPFNSWTYNPPPLPNYFGWSSYDLPMALPMQQQSLGFGDLGPFEPISPFDQTFVTSALAGDPVSMISGNLHHSETDLVIPGDGPDFELTRSYNSRVEEAGALGFGWTHSYEARVEGVRDENTFVYLPSSQTNFSLQDRIEGVRSDTLETVNAGTGSTETIRWEALPVAFRSNVSVDSIDLEIAFKGAFNMTAGLPSALADPGPVTGSASVLRNETIRLRTDSGTDYIDLSQPIQISLASFDSADTVHYARLRVRYRGPAVERESLAPQPLSGWSDGLKLEDGDPSTCTAPTASNDEGTIQFTPSAPNGLFGYELLVSVARQTGTTGAVNASIRRGSTSGGETIRLGPDAEQGRQFRFVSVNPTDSPFQVVFDADLNSFTRDVELCHVDYRLLVLPQDQRDVVMGDGSRLRFTKIGGVWKSDPGVREKLAENGSDFVLTQVDGSTLRFEPAVGGHHRLKQIADAAGRPLNLTYVAGTDNVLAVSEDNTIVTSDGTGPFTPQLTFAYDANGKLDTVTDWTGRAWDYTVTNGHLVEVKDPVESDAGKPGTKYEYGFAADTQNDALVHNLTRVIYPKDGTDPDTDGDHQVEFGYFNSDRVASHTDSLGNGQRYLYNTARLESEAIDARGFRTFYRYDRVGNLVQRVDPDGAAWDWQFDADRRVILETDPLGFSRTFEYVLPGGGACETIDRGNPCRIVDRDGLSTLVLYDASSGKPTQTTDKRGNVSRDVYVNGLLTERRATVNGFPDTLIESYIYAPESHRRLEKTIRMLEPPDGPLPTHKAETRFFYLTGNRDVERIEVWEDTDGDGGYDFQASARDLEYDRLGRLAKEQVQRIDDPDGTTSSVYETGYQYSLRGQVERVTRPDGTVLVSEYDDNENIEARYLEEPLPKPVGGSPVAQHQRVDFVYDATDRLIRTTDAFNHHTTFEYDAAGNRTATTDPLGNVSRAEYDSLNRVQRTIDGNGSISRVEYDLAGHVVREIDPTGIATERQYDEVGRLIELSQAGGVPATRTPIYGPGTAYREELRDPNLNLTVFKFDELGRVFEVVDAKNQTLRAGYDLGGNLIRFEDGAGKVSTFKYDALGQKAEVNHAWASNAQVVKYDETGNPVRITRPDGCRLDMTYDGLGRLLTRKSDAATCDGSVDDRYGYDARGNVVAAKNAHVGLIREYDGLDRLVRETDDRFGTSVGYAYDAASRLTARVYPDGLVVNVSHDAAGRPIGITDPWGDTTRYVYDAAGRRIETQSSASGLATNLTYDARGRLASISSTRSNGTLGASYSYPLYDEAGNRKQMKDTLAEVTDYAYDELHRLASVNPPGGGSADTIHYQYDAGGNRTRSGLKSGASWVAPYTDYTYPTSGPAHRLTNVTTHTGASLHAFPGYDANGNPTSWSVAGGSARTLTWDALDQLASISGGFSASYRYDPFGRRIQKTEQGVTTLYQYDGLDVVAEYDAAKVQQATYVFGPGIDEPLRIERGTTVGAFHGDGIGSVVLVSDTGSAADLATYKYDAFGVVQSTSGTLANSYTYTGRERDASGLYYYRARYYLPEVGRFLTPDPLGLSDGSNPYTYVGSNPVNFRDPFGLIASSADYRYQNFATPSGIGGSFMNDVLGLPANIGPFDPTPDFDLGPSYGLLPPEQDSRPASILDYSATWVAGAVTLGTLPAAVSVLEGSTLWNQALMVAAPLPQVATNVATQAYIGTSLAVGAALTRAGDALTRGGQLAYVGASDFSYGLATGYDAGSQGNFRPAPPVASFPGYAGTYLGVAAGFIDQTIGIDEAIQYGIALFD